jgi:hypothetical protein
MHRTARLALCCLGFVMACSSSSAPTADNPATTAAEGLDAAQGVNDEAAVLELTTEGSDSAAVAVVAGRSGVSAAPPTADQVATYMANHVGAELQPATCHSVTTNGATDVFSYNDCTGPRGLTHMTGTMTVTYSVDVQGVHAHSTATSFVINQSTLDIDATATYTATSGSRSLTVTSTSSGTGPLGHSVTRQGSYTVTWTSTCHTLDGSWSTTANGLTGSLTVTQVTRCSGHCPEAGGSVTHTKLSGVTVTITYDGTAIAHWTSGSKSGSIQLSCLP